MLKVLHEQRQSAYYYLTLRIQRDRSLLPELLNTPTFEEPLGGDLIVDRNNQIERKAPSERPVVHDLYPQKSHYLVLCNISYDTVSSASESLERSESISKKCNFRSHST
jgi:hypothetical protein